MKAYLYVVLSLLVCCNIIAEQSDLKPDLKTAIQEKNVEKAKNILIQDLNAAVMANDKNQVKEIINSFIPQAEIALTEKGSKRYVALNSDVINNQDAQGYTPLMHAAKAGYSSVVEELRNAGANAKIRTRENGVTAYTLAKEGGYNEIAEKLSKVWNPSLANDLREAIMASDLKKVKRLMGQDVNLDAKDHHGDTLLMLAVKRGSNDSPDTIKIIEMLYEAGADVNAQNNQGTTPLMLAAKKAELDLVFAILASSKADVNLKDKDGKTAFFILSDIAPGPEKKTSAFSAYSRVRDMVKTLIKYGADINAKNKDGWTVLINAASKGNAEMVEILIGQGADVNIKDNQGMTALDWAKQGKHHKVEQLLLEKGAPASQAVLSESKGLKNKIDAIIASKKISWQAAADNSLATELMTVNRIIEDLNSLFKHDAEMDNSPTMKEFRDTLVARAKAIEAEKAAGTSPTALKNRIDAVIASKKVSWQAAADNSSAAEVIVVNRIIEDLNSLFKHDAEMANSPTMKEFRDTLVARVKAIEAEKDK